MQIKVDSKKVIETDEMTRQEILAVKEQIEAMVLKLDYDLALAVAHKHETGEYANPTWFAKATLALKLKRATVQKLNQALRVKGRPPKAQPGRMLAHYFMDICREKMPPELFEKTLALARKRQAQGGGDPESEDEPN